MIHPVSAASELGLAGAESRESSGFLTSYNFSDFAAQPVRTRGTRSANQKSFRGSLAT